MLLKQGDLNKDERSALCSSLGLKHSCGQALEWTRMYCLEGRLPSAIFEGFDHSKLEKMFKDFAKKIDDGEDLRLKSQIESPLKQNSKKYKGNSRFGNL